MNTRRVVHYAGERFEGGKDMSTSYMLDAQSTFPWSAKPVRSFWYSVVHRFRGCCGLRPG